MMEPEGDAGIHPFQKKCTMHSHQRKFLVYVDVCFLILALFLQAYGTKMEQLFQHHNPLYLQLASSSNIREVVY